MTPADKPDLPPPDTWAYVSEADGLQPVWTAARLRRLLADERGKALTDAIEAVEETDEATVFGSQSYYCQLGDAVKQRRDCADSIRALIDKEPKT